MAIGDKVKALLRKHGDKVDKAIDKAGDMADKRTGGKYARHIDTAQEQAKKAVDRIEESGEGGRPGHTGEGPAGRP